MANKKLLKDAYNDLKAARQKVQSAKGKIKKAGYDTEEIEDIDYNLENALSNVEESL